MSGAVTLDARLDYQAVAPLVDCLRSDTSDDLVINAGSVSHIGALALQVLLSAVKTRAATGKTTRMTNASDACVDQLRLFGFSPETLTNPEAWT